MRAKLEACAEAICRTVLREAKHGKWDSAVEQALHTQGFRYQLNPLLVSQVISRGLFHRHLLALGFFSWAAQQPGYNHTATVYGTLFKCLLNAKQFKSLEKILKQMKKERIEMNSSLFSTIIAFQIQSGKVLKAYQTFSEVRDSGLKLRPDTYNAVLGGLSSGGHMDLAYRVYSRTRSDGVQLGFISFGVFIRVFCKSEDIRKVLDLVDDARVSVPNFKGSIVSAMIVSGLCRACRIDEACWVLEELRARDCMPDFVAYCTVIESLREKGCVQEAHRLLKQKRKLSVAPRLYDYQEFIFALIGDKKFAEALEIVNLIRTANFRIDKDLYDVLIGSVSGFDPLNAASLFSEMLNAGYSPNGLTICNLIRGLFNSGKPEILFEVFEKLEGRGIVCDIPTYNCIVYFLCKGRKVKEAYRVLEEMKKNELRPGVEAYNALMDACCSAELLRPARRLWDEMFREGCSPTVQTYNILISAFLRAGEVSDARNLYCNMSQKGLAPDLVTYRSLIYGLTKENLLDEASQIYDDFMKTGMAQSIVLPDTLREAVAEVRCPTSL